MIYTAKCAKCNKEDRVKMMVFFKDKPFCWNCRCELISKWVIELRKYKCHYLNVK
jgi:hypothetical protein